MIKLFSYRSRFCINYNISMDWKLNSSNLCLVLPGASEDLVISCLSALKGDLSKHRQLIFNFYCMIYYLNLYRIRLFKKKLGFFYETKTVNFRSKLYIRTIKLNNFVVHKITSVILISPGDGCFYLGRNMLLNKVT